MIYLYVDRDYQQSYSWLFRYQVLKRAARKKRVDIIEIESIDSIPADDNSAMVLIRSASRHFLTETVIKANERRVYPVIIANMPPYSGLHCSSIGNDMRDETLYAMEFLTSIGCRSLAFFGVNPAPYSDQYRASVFQEVYGSADDIFRMDPYFSTAFERFLSSSRKYDGVIVCNIATAVAFITGLKAHGYTKETLPRVIAFGHLGLVKYFSPSISSIAEDVSNLGEVVFNLYDTIQRCGNGTKIQVYLNTLIESRETTGFIDPDKSMPYARYTQPFKRNTYFDSPEIAEVMTVERLLQNSDEIDISIIYGILGGDTYETIAEKLSLSLNAVNYRVKRIKHSLDCNGISELKTLLGKYFYE